MDNAEEYIAYLESVRDQLNRLSVDPRLSGWQYDFVTPMREISEKIQRVLDSIESA